MLTAVCNIQSISILLSIGEWGSSTFCSIGSDWISIGFARIHVLIYLRIVEIMSNCDRSGFRTLALFSPLDRIQIDSSLSAISVNLCLAIQNFASTSVRLKLLNLIKCAINSLTGIPSIISCDSHSSVISCVSSIPTKRIVGIISIIVCRFMKPKKQTGTVTIKNACASRVDRNRSAVSC